MIKYHQGRTQDFMRKGGLKSVEILGEVEGLEKFLVHKNEKVWGVGKKCFILTQIKNILQSKMSFNNKEKYVS